MCLSKSPSQALLPPPIHLIRVIDRYKYCSCIERPDLIFGRKPTKKITPSPKGLSTIKFNFPE